MGTPDPGRGTGGGQHVGGHVADGVEHGDARGTGPVLHGEQTRRREHRHRRVQLARIQAGPVEHLPGEPRCGTPGEHAQHGQHPPRRGTQPGHAPLHSGPQRVLPVGQVDRLRPQRRAVPVELGQQVGRIKGAQLGRGELDGQRQPVQSPAQPGQYRCVVRGQPEPRPHRAGPLHQQRDRGVVGHVRRVGRGYR